MATFNIYGYNDGEDSEPQLVVSLNDDNTEIVEITSVDPDSKAEAEEVLKFYMDSGLSAVNALFRYAGSYGTVESADGSAQVEPQEDEADRT